MLGGGAPCRTRCLIWQVRGRVWGPVPYHDQVIAPVWDPGLAWAHCAAGPVWDPAALHGGVIAPHTEAQCASLKHTELEDKCYIII